LCQINKYNMYGVMGTIIIRELYYFKNYSLTTDVISVNMSR